MEIYRTEITIETDNPKKGYAKMDELLKEGYEHVSTNMIAPQVMEARYVFKLSKMEQFK